MNERAAGWMALLVATLGVWGLLAAREPDGPGQLGVVELELAATSERASAIVGGWTDAVRSDVTGSLWIDLLAFIPLYAVVLFTAVRWAGAVYRSSALRRLAGPLSGAMLLAAALDVVENLALFRVVDGTVESPWPLVATAASWPKWFLVVAGILFVLAAGVVRVGRRFVANPFRPGDCTPPDPEWSPPVAPKPTRPAGFSPPPWRDENEWAPQPERLGICCSGGGIRSAAWNLGVLQSLQLDGELARARYLSAVSGGSYIAGGPHVVDHASDAELLEEQRAFAPGTPEEAYLRNRSTYLWSTTRGFLWGVARLAMGLAVNLLFLYLLGFVLLRPMGWLLQEPWLYPTLRTARPEVSVLGAVWLAAGVLGAAGGLAALTTVVWRYDDRTERHVLGIAATLTGLALVLFLTLAVVPSAVQVVPQALAWVFNWLTGVRPAQEGDAETTINAVWLLEATGALTLLIGAAGKLAVSQRSLLGRFAGSVVSTLMAGLLVVVLVDGAAAHGPHADVVVAGHALGPEWVVWLGAGAVLTGFYLLSDQTTWSLHPWYKRRLARVFALRRVTRDGRAVAESISPDRLLPLFRFGKATPRVPELLVCAAANLTDEDATPPGRAAVSFVFTADEAGGPDVGWVRHVDLWRALGRRRRTDVTLPAAVAISGAALSPAMGKHTKRGLSPVLAIANARLGVWLPNPRWVEQLKEGVPGVAWIGRPRVGYLLKEILRHHDSTDRFLYVTDGGHWENLGLVELLRRGCTEVYCFDASGDGLRTFHTLGEAVALARTELGIEIDIDPAALLPPDDAAPPPLSPVCTAVGTFRYPDLYGTRGVLVYVKATPTEDLPWDVRDYGVKDARFPFHSTGDQVFDHQQFEAYHALGRDAGEQAVASMRAATLGG